MNRTQALIVGHYCHDTLFHANGTRSDTLGGSASYISSVFNALKVKCSVASKVGMDFAYYPQIHHRPRVAMGVPTTQFIADFTHGERTERVGAVCESIYPKDIPDGEIFDIALAVGIVGEILPDTLRKLAQCSHYLLCDIQGLIRVISPQGTVGYEKLNNTPFYPLLDQISFLKASRQEAQSLNLDEVRQHTCLLVTEGKDGCTVYLRDREFRVPAFPAEEIDPTGAGDCFLAGFAAGLLRQLPLEKAVLMGNYFGALAVGQIGVPRLEPFKIPEFSSCYLH
jgi:1D-myo-inositol 3-kinase